MTKKEYEHFQRTVKRFMEMEGLENLSTVSEEPYFSWMPCDCCGSQLGGDRYDSNGYNREKKQVQDGYGVCGDCIYYVEYGRLDDTTMLDMEEEAEHARQK